MTLLGQVFIVVFPLRQVAGAPPGSEKKHWQSLILSRPSFKTPRANIVNRDRTVVRENDLMLRGQVRSKVTEFSLVFLASELPGHLSAILGPGLKSKYLYCPTLEFLDLEGVPARLDLNRLPMSRSLVCQCDLVLVTSSQGYSKRKDKQQLLHLIALLFSLQPSAKYLQTSKSAR